MRGFFFAVFLSAALIAAALSILAIYGWLYVTAVLGPDLKWALGAALAAGILFFVAGAIARLD